MEPIYIYAIIAAVCSAVILLCMVPKKNQVESYVRQGFSVPTMFSPYPTPAGTQQIGIGAYPTDYPSMIGIGTVWNSSDQSAPGLVKKWYNFADAIGPDLSGAIYALFPDLQTPQSIDNYGLTEG